MTAPAPVVDGTLRFKGLTLDQWEALKSIAGELGVPVGVSERVRPA